MPRFYEFLSDLKWSLAVIIAAFLLCSTCEKVEVSVGKHEGLYHDQRLAVYESFLRNDVLAKRLREAFSVGKSAGDDYKKFSAMRSFLNPDTLAERQANFFKLSPVEGLTLLAETDTLYASLLTAKENERWNKLEVNWSWVWSQTFSFWQLGTVLCLLVWWWHESYRMSYFPVKKWWFWGYLILAYPWSQILLFLLGASLLFNLKSRWRSKYLQKKLLSTPYEEFCAGLMKEVGEVRRQWEDMFSRAYLGRKIGEARVKVNQLRARLINLGQEMEGAEQEYSSAKAELATLEAQAKSATETATQREWASQLENLLGDPRVKAIRFVDRGWEPTLEIYTSVFNTFWGRLGPMKIVVWPYDGEGKFKAWLAHKAAAKGSLAAETGSSERNFCFGTNYDIIAGFLKRKEIDQAVRHMFSAFSSASDAVVE